MVAAVSFSSASHRFCSETRDDVVLCDYSGAVRYLYRVRPRLRGLLREPSLFSDIRP